MAPRSRLAGAGFKPPQAAVVKRCYEAEGCGLMLLRLFQHRSFEEMTLVVEGVVGHRMDVEETLRGAG